MAQVNDDVDIEYVLPSDSETQRLRLGAHVDVKIAALDAALSVSQYRLIRGVLDDNLNATPSYVTAQEVAVDGVVVAHGPAIAVDVVVQVSRVSVCSEGALGRPGVVPRLSRRLVPVV